MTAMRQDQEIRAEAVRTVTLGAASGGIRNNKEYWGAVLQLEEYIRTGSHPMETKDQAFARSNRTTNGTSSV